MIDTTTYIRFAASLVLVLGLVLAMLWLIRRFGLGGVVVRSPARRRLAVVETATVDSRRRLVMVRRDGREYLLLVGGVTDLVIDGWPQGDDTQPATVGRAETPAPGQTP